ncbi:hypothetical protein MNEG_9078 [Monoraphidium neglectum]|uniref:Beta-glucuronidase C-terminal domain-containing protein n=1 Tax=Monoraphidium neglectum TaxID=145388 RepID=A0A0D2MDQ7_9CHLO|nr:hypothetical protein MNEG_9078 [Monoraphidium neglectum]KIY98881.1 hypothetical protein MNEG_9078 [Monoraphidium neglectum]|eukprot:XP_013897901.1 hypothetical protein MNEG_9078 [Monoraphidium neglectum]
MANWGPTVPDDGEVPRIRATLSVNVDGWSKQVPGSFLGISHEWVAAEELADPDTLQLLKDLAAYGTGALVMRIGGGSTDLQRTVPGPRVWAALRKLHQETGAVFILGINFLAEDFQLTQRQMQAIRRELPNDAVLAIELGNEPNFYPKKRNKDTADYLACCYVNDWNGWAVPLSCPAGSASCWTQQFAGPAWGHVHMSPETLDWFLRVNIRWVSMATVHWYKDRAETFNTAKSLLDEAKMRRDATSLAKLVETAGKYQKALRVAEMNTISNNGLRGVSDTMSGALWALDAAFEVAATGATGVNFHWGSGQNVYSAVILRTQDGKPPIMALSTGSRLLLDSPLIYTAGQRGSVKAWPLVRTSDGSLRTVIINKHATDSARLAVSINRGSLGGGKLLRLRAPGGLFASGGVQIARVSYGWESTETVGTPAGERLRGKIDAAGNTVFDVRMPPGSAALLIVAPKNNA